MLDDVIVIGEASSFHSTKSAVEIVKCGEKPRSFQIENQLSEAVTQIMSSLLSLQYLQALFPYPLA